MQYVPTRLKKSFIVNDIVTVHYFEYEKNYAFVGEAHDFWELVYVDKGDIEIVMGEDTFKLEQGSIAFHQPNEHHNLKANGVVAPNIVIVSFVCKSKAMDFFKGRILPLSDIEKGFLATIIRETVRCFSSPLEDTFLKKLERREETFFGSEQMISNSLEQLLISLYRNFGEKQMNTSKLKRGIQQNLVDNILQFMQENIHNKLTIQIIADAMGVSRTGVSVLFKEKMGEGVMSYFAKMKINVAKSMIREGNYNISQLASFLGFDSIHLFSRRFKQITGMTPTEYGKSVKVDFETSN